jgi:hypothetical protein
VAIEEAGRAETCNESYPFPALSEVRQQRGYVMYRFRSGLGALTLPQAIFRQEGSTDASGNWVTSSLGYRLNNPGNLNYAGQPGCHPTTLGNGMEAQCDTLEAGIAATERQLGLDASRGLTLQQRLSTWATGNRDAYVQNVSNWMGVDPNTPLSALPLGSGVSIPPLDGSQSLDTGSQFDFSGGGVQSDGQLSPMAWGALALAAGGLLWAAAS